MRSRFLHLLGLAGVAFAATGCNMLFGIQPGQSETGGSGGTTDTGGTTTGGTTSTGGTGGVTGGTGGVTGGGDAGTTSTGGAGGGPSCTPLSVSCEGAILHACDADGFPLPDVTCEAPAACDAPAKQCNTLDTFGRLALGAGRGCAILDDKSVRCWGTDGGGAVFVDPPTVQATAIPVPDLSARQVAMGSRFQCALQDDATVVCWGNNDYGQLGFLPGPEQTPQAVPGLPPAVQIAASSGCTCARLADGTVDCWGLEDYGCLGTGHDVIGNQPVPTPIPGVTDAVEIAMGLAGSPSCARHGNGTVTCWFDTIKPTLIPDVDDAVDVAVGYLHVFIRSASKGLLYSARTDDNTSFRPAVPYVVGSFSSMAAGLSFLGKKANGSLVRSRLDSGIQPDPPVAVAGVPAGDIVEIVAGPNYYGEEDVQCLRLGGQPFSSSVYCWGDDVYGGLGIGAPEYIKSPQEVPGISDATYLFGSQESTSAVMSDGSVVYWGRARGLLDLATATPTTVALLDIDNTAVTNVDIWAEAYVKKQNGSFLFMQGGVPVANKKLLACGGTYATALGFGHYDVGLLTNGQVTVYGDYDDSNIDGVYGDGTVTSTPGQCSVVPGITGATAIAAYGDDYNPRPSHLCAIVPNGSLQCWGHNYYGEVGNGVNQGDPVPTPTTIPMPNGEAVVSVAAGALFTCAVVASGKVYCWGWNENGQLGLPNIQNTPQPTLAVVQISNAVAVTARQEHACALLSDQTVKCWGSNEFGQLGDGTFLDSAAPKLVPGISNVAEVRAGSYHTCIRRTNGTVACWGSSYDGQVGTGLTGRFDTPTQVLGL